MLCPHWSGLQPGRWEVSMQAESSQKPTWSIQKAQVPLAPSTSRPAAGLSTQTRVIAALLENVVSECWTIISFFPTGTPFFWPFRMFCAVWTHRKDGEQYTKSITVLLSSRASPGKTHSLHTRCNKNFRCSTSFRSRLPTYPLVGPAWFQTQWWERPCRNLSCLPTAANWEACLDWNVHIYLQNNKKNTKI